MQKPYVNLEAFNITQHIKFPTDNLGHTLDIIATEIRQNRNVTGRQKHETE